MSEIQQTAAQRRRAALVARLAWVRHWLLGGLAVTPVPGTVFNPREFLRSPERLPSLLAYWAGRARRDGCGAGLPRRLRDAACEQAAQATLTYFLDADYRRAGVTADEFARAVLGAYKRCRRAYWRDAAEDRDAARVRMANRRGARRQGDCTWFNRARNSRAPDPARVVIAADALGMDPNAVTGEGVTDEVPGRAVAIPGGPSGRGETDGHMECVTIRDVAVNVPGGAFCRARLELSQIETRWRMVRGRGRAQRLPPALVIDSIPVPRPVFRQIPPPADGVRQPEGITNARRPRQPLPTVTPADALYNLRRLGRGVSTPQDRRRIAAAIRRHRAAARG